MVTPYDPARKTRGPQGPPDPPDRAGRPGPRGRGAGFNPANRFEPLRYEAEPEENELSGETTPSPETLFLRDPSRSVVAFNESPDVGFAASLNPYRGCEHGCVYCLAPETPILHADLVWRPLGEVRVGDTLVGFDEVPLPGQTRKLRPAVVEAVWWSRKPTLRLVTQRAEVVTTAEHRWLQAGDLGWSTADKLGPGTTLSWLTTPVSKGSMVCEPEPVEAVEAGPERDVVDIQTSTGTFYAAGLATHNCYARPTHEYLGFSAGLDFETRILVKPEAPALLRQALSAKSWKPQVLAVSGVTDPYQPIERKLRITRGCLEVLAEFRNPVFVITKNRLVARDADLIGELARVGAAGVALSVTTLDPDLHRVMEPRTSRPELRLEAIARLAEAGIPTGVMVAPVIPALNEPEIPAILEAAAKEGASFAGCVLLRLPHAVAPLFEDWLARHFPERKDKVLNRIRELRGGRLNDPRFGSRMRGRGIFAESMRALFEIGCRRAGIEPSAPELNAEAFRPPQLRLFD